MRVKKVERKDDCLILVLSMETCASISIKADPSINIEKEYIGIRNWGYFEDLRLTIKNAPEKFAFLLRESEWGRKGRNYYYEIIVNGNEVDTKLIKSEGNGYYAIVGLLR